MSAGFKTLAQGFSLGERFFPWGTTVGALRDAFAGVAPLKAYEPSSMRYPCPQAYGFAATVFYARGPAEDRPVLNLTVDLAPYAGRYDGIRAGYWLEAIHSGLGRPERVYDCSGAARPPGASGVAYSASWISGGASLSFSLYGGFRDDPGGRAVAGLFLGWNDTAAAAAPFMAAAEERDGMLAGLAAAEAQLRLFELRSAQRPFTAAPGYPPQPPPDDRLRLAQCVLRKPGLHRTPQVWSTHLRDNQVALWRTADGSRWGLANRWDAVAFRSGEAVAALWLNTLPAKGGGMSLAVGDFAVEEPHSSAPLRELVAALEPLLGRSVACEEGYDC